MKVILTSFLIGAVHALPSFCPTPVPTAVRPAVSCGPDNYVSGNGGGGSCGICTDNCGNDNPLILNFFGLTGDSSDVQSISNNNGAIDMCKDIDPHFVCCGPKYTYGTGGVFVKNSQWYTDPQHGHEGTQPPVAGPDSGVCSYGIEGDSSSWLLCSGSDGETCTGGASLEKEDISSSSRRQLENTNIFSVLTDVEVIEMVKDISIETLILIACTTLTVNGNGFEINGQSKTGIFHISHAVVLLNDLIINNGSSIDNGGGILVDGTSTVTLNRCTITSCQAMKHGGGFYFSGHGFLTLNMFDSYIRSNQAMKGSGGGIYSSGDTIVLNLVRTSFTKNTCHDDGGGLCVRGNGTKSIDSLQCSYKSNHAGKNGGGIFVGDGGTTVSSDTSNTIVGNIANKQGGGLYIGGIDNTAVVSHYDITVSHNTASGIYDETDEIYYEDGGEVQLTECRASKNDVGSNGYIKATVSSSTSCEVSTTYTRGSRTCFSSEDMLTFENGDIKPFRDLKIGDQILSANRDGEFSYSAIVFLPHHGENHIKTKFIEIKTENDNMIKMTRRHLIPTCDDGKLLVAEDLQPGDCLLTIKGNDIVSTVEEVDMKGVYTAVTENEFIVVNGIIASPFASPTAIVHALYNATDAESWCKSNNWLAYESAQHQTTALINDGNDGNGNELKEPSKDCMTLLSEMFENYKDEPIGWGVSGWGYKGWKNPSSRDGEPRVPEGLKTTTKTSSEVTKQPSKKHRSMLLEDILSI